MEHLIDKIIASHNLLLEVDSEFDTCGVDHYGGPKWHLLNYSDFLKIAEALGEKPVRDTRCADKVYAAKYLFTHRGVTVFCLRMRVEEANDASTAN